MQERAFDELGERSSLALEKRMSSLVRKLEAKHAISEQLEAMKDEDKVLMLDEDEERMLRAFRAFRLRAKPGDLFKWKPARLTDPAVGVYRETGLIRDPQEQS